MLRLLLLLLLAAACQFTPFRSVVTHPRARRRRLPGGGMRRRATSRLPAPRSPAPRRAWEYSANARATAAAQAKKGGRSGGKGRETWSRRPATTTSAPATGGKEPPRHLVLSTARQCRDRKEDPSRVGRGGDHVEDGQTASTPASAQARETGSERSTARWWVSGNVKK
ncbi:hypothetical protein [Oryza sativa Japonica Group]|uniref:Uncharacterized protein n=1 Tax=Oryza sativa subsp. japonica TaxID=39947 RepID=Q5N868_ORYSJ|nr:hypothetical protein OsJ_04489 [Oryza sativa Japonica Group]BAD82330.1 hypothetical protein [Oryza sativa Japonica Group]